MHRALPVGLTYSSTHTHTEEVSQGMEWGWYTFPSLWFGEGGRRCVWMGCGGVGWGGWLASPVSSKGNKGPLCPVGVGPCCHGHGQVHWQEHVERGLKVGGGGKEWLGLARHVMARRRPGPFLTLKKICLTIIIIFLKWPNALHVRPLDSPLSWERQAATIKTHACTMTLHHTCVNPHSADVHSRGSTL